MVHSKLIAFDRPLAGAAIAGEAARYYTSQELAARDEVAYARGVDSTRALADRQMVELRSEIERLADGVFGKLSRVEPTLVAELRQALPALALELARRLLAGYEPHAEVVSRMCEEALTELFPERENLELVVSARDAALLDQLQPDWVSRYPGLRIRAEASLVPGDCQVRSRFGLTDARLQTKLTALEHGLLAT
jgi:flagellar assembly protein FliH